MNTGGGESAHKEEGLVIVEGEPGVFATIPALIADSPRTQLPCGCDMLLGNGEIREMQISLDYHRDAPRDSVLRSNLSDRFSLHRDAISLSDLPIECNMGEKDCKKWLEANGDKAPDVAVMSIDDIHVNAEL